MIGIALVVALLIPSWPVRPDPQQYSGARGARPLYQRPLVFLSGCATGLGSAWSTLFDRSEDYATLAQAFLYAGARNVVATLWRVADESAADFAAHFYAALPPLGAADALAQAQRRMLADPRYRAPYFWASYQVSGSGKAITASRP